MKTKTLFDKKFLGVISPECSGASYPEFNPAGINESRFSHSLRPKEYAIRVVNDDTIEIDWKSQNWDYDHGIDSLVAEINRCFAYIGLNVEVKLHVHARDGNPSEKRDFHISCKKTDSSGTIESILSKHGLLDNKSLCKDLNDFVKQKVAEVKKQSQSEINNLKQHIYEMLAEL